MSYDYQTERPALFTEEGVRILIAMRDTCRQMLKQSGAFAASKAMSKAMESITGSSWVMLAALEYMVERGELKKITQPEAWAQHEIYAAGEAWREQ